MNRSIYILAPLLIGGFVVLSIIQLISLQTPYLRFVAELKGVTDRPIWFVGSIIHSESRFDSSSDEFIFRLRDPRGQTVGVRFKGIKPTGFDRAHKALVRGSYYGSEIIAHQIILDRESPYR